MQSITWCDLEELNKISWIKKYNNACQKWLSKTPDEISVYYSYFTLEEHKFFVEDVCNKLDLKLNGTGLEIGSGPGIFSNSILKIFNDIDKIYLLDKVPEAYLLQKKIAEHNKTNDKLINVIGDFNYLKFENESLDFVLDFDSIHHSEDFELTFKEINRVLKPGGKLFCFDRGQPNYISKKQIQFLLNIEYSKDYKIENGINPKSKYSRRMNGETEPYLRDWLNAAKTNNFISSKVYLFQRKSQRHFFRLLYGLIVPFFLKKIINKGVSITSHYESLLSYFGINKFGLIIVKKLDYKPKLKVSPQEKMVFLFSK